MSRQFAVAVVLSLNVVTGCVSTPHDESSSIPAGTYTGKAAIGWDDRDDYVYMPVASQRLEYTIPQGVRISDDPRINDDPNLRTIRPKTMRTDAGSIPRILWSVKGLAPLDYLPAYIIHDWLYMQHRCHGKQVSVYRKDLPFPYSRPHADRILKEMLDQIDAESSNPAGNQNVRNLIFKAVDEFGGKAWNDKDKSNCKPVKEFEVVVVTRMERVSGAFMKDGSPIYHEVKEEVRKPRYRPIVVVGK